MTMSHYCPLLYSPLSSISLILLIASCSPKEQPIDQNSYNLGSMTTFCEMVGAGVKQLAISPVIKPEEMDNFYKAVLPIANEFNVKIQREKDLIITDLFPADAAKGKEVILIYNGQTLAAYEQLKSEIAALSAKGEYSSESRLSLSRRFGRLLSYSPQKINQLLTANTAFRTMSDFGIRASNVFLYYDDLAKATSFYTKTLGLELLAEYDNASILRVAGSSYLILVDAAKGMHSTDEPKTVALALLTNQLQGWYDHLKSNKVPIKYDYKPKEGGAHDGFVAIDPEGYLLEFETFKQHPENERFIPILNTNENVNTSIDGLSFNGAITWLYHKDILGMQGFYEQVLGLEMVADQGWAKIYKVTGSGFIGLVDERRGMYKFTKEKAVTVSFIIDDLDGWFNYVKANAPFELRSEEVSKGPESMYRAFVGYGPEGYFLEFDRFYEHPTNVKLMQYLSYE